MPSSSAHASSSQAVLGVHLQQSCATSLSALKRTNERSSLFLYLLRPLISVHFSQRIIHLPPRRNGRDRQTVCPLPDRAVQMSVVSHRSNSQVCELTEPAVCSHPTLPAREGGQLGKNALSRAITRYQPRRELNPRDAYLKRASLCEEQHKDASARNDCQLYRLSVPIA